MEIQKILSTYDGMFGTCSMEEVEAFLDDALEQARQEQAISAQITLLNEKMGLMRSLKKKEPCYQAMHEVQKVFEKTGLADTKEYGTLLLNLANAKRAFGDYEDAKELFQKAEGIYNRLGFSDDYLYASLYNNWSILCQEMGQDEQALLYLENVLHRIDRMEQAKVEQASTRTNLSVLLLHMYQKDPKNENLYEKAEKFADQAVHRFETSFPKEYHFSAALTAKGDVKFIKKQYEEAARLYYRGLKNMEDLVGKKGSYGIMKKKLQTAIEKLSYHEKSRLLYEWFGKPMLETCFPEYVKEIAVGLSGEGSECLGYEDVYSSDHDFDLGFCMWLSKETYEKTGASLQQAYEQMLREQDVFEIKQGVKQTESRRRVWEIGQFFETVFQARIPDITQAFLPQDTIWFFGKEEQFRTAVSGWIFTDPKGQITMLRERLGAHYPKRYYISKLAEAVHGFSQAGQYNYGRMMARGEVIGALRCKEKAIESAYQLLFLLNHVYAPYYKWLHKAAKELPLLPEVPGLLEQAALQSAQEKAWEGIGYDASKINEKDKVVSCMEEIARVFGEELEKQGWIQKSCGFLDQHVTEIVEKCR